ncbi:QRFP-like peptide receptor [Lingula anatina]|uniref:QRFP-like peptide receptor n=1 Tax=Lingula anatina TaxID=7574 RepID=A0A2R2MRX2_LINAN|nr:QRFP-like peptide receptor [Lingula anatina]|eukprot:XP_023933004.1 QRFP-like peptide receptor [Lingula anatina]
MVNVSRNGTLWPPAGPRCAFQPGEQLPFNPPDPKWTILIPNQSSPAIPLWEVVVKVLVTVLLVLHGIIGNALVIVIVMRNKAMKQQVINMYLVNLAVTDILVVLTCSWTNAGAAISVEYPFHSSVCKGSTFLEVTFLTCSVLTLTIIAVDRFFVIVYPLKCRITHRRVTICLVLVWLVSIAVASPHLVVRDVYEVHWKNRVEVSCLEVWPKYIIDHECNTEAPGKFAYTFFTTVVMYFCPILVMSLAYLMIGCALWNRQFPGVQLDSVRSSRNKAKKRVIRMLLVVLVAFIVCWTPEQAIVLFDLYRDRSNTQVRKDHIKHQQDFDKRIKFAVFYLAQLNSALNPVMYGGLNENFRRGFARIFRAIWTANRVEPTRPSDQLGNGMNPEEGGQAGQLQIDFREVKVRRKSQLPLESLVEENETVIRISYVSSRPGATDVGHTADTEDIPDEKSNLCITRTSEGTSKQWKVNYPCGAQPAGTAPSCVVPNKNIV